MLELSSEAERGGSGGSEDVAFSVPSLLRLLIPAAAGAERILA